MKLTVAVLMLASALTARATLVMLGDSLSDGGLRGNVPNAFGGLLPGSVLVNERLSSGQANPGAFPAAPYYYGRFTNGPVWIETAAGLLGQAVDNFAVGGANGNTGRIIVKPPYGFVQGNTPVPVPSIVQQAQAYASLKANGARSFQDSVIIFAGPDEYFQRLSGGAADVDPSGVIGAVRQALNITYTAGVRKFVLVDHPALSAFPFTASLPNSDAVDGLTGEHNAQLNDLATSFNSTNPDAQVYVYDLSNLAQDVITNPTNDAWLGDFTNTTGAVLGNGDLDTIQAEGFSNTVAPNPEGYIFWDPFHPSSHFHYVFGEDFANQMRPMLAATLIDLAQTTAASSASS